MTYTAPLADMRFALREVAGLQQVAALPGYEHATDDTVDAVLEEAAKLAGNGLAPLNREGDKVGAKLENGVVRTAPGFAGIYKEFVAGGWNSLPFDPEFGGQGMPWLLAATVQEMWQAANMGFGLVLLLNQGAIDAIHHHGSAEQKAAYLPKLISGEWTGTMNLTEPQAGSDLGQLKSRAVTNGRPLPDHRPEDLHHLRRARHGREHRAPGAGAHARRAGRRARHLAVHRAEVPGRRRRQAGQAQRSALRVARAQARHPCQPDLRHVVRRRRRRGRLSGRRGRPRPFLHVHHDEQRPAVGRHPGPGHRRARLPAGRGLRQDARAVQGRRQRRSPSRSRSSITPTCGAC